MLGWLVDVGRFLASHGVSFWFGGEPLAAVNFVSVDDGLQMLRQKAHRQSPSLYLVSFEAVCLFASEQSRLRGAAEETDEASRL
jgi:hypothetical protein